MNSKFKQNFIDRFFSKLNEDLICYAILRNYSKLPQISGDDIDIFIDNNNLNKFINLYLSSVINTLGWSYKLKYSKEGFISIVCFSVNDDTLETLQLDFFNAFDWRGIAYLDVDYIKKSIQDYNQFRVVSIGSELAITSIKEILGYGFLRKKHEKRFKDYFYENKQDFILAISPNYRSKFDDLFSNWITNANSDCNKVISKAIKNTLIVNNPVRFLYFSFIALTTIFSKIFRKKHMIVFLGPDGSGKTTLINNYSKAIDRFFPDNIRIYHRRYGLLPELKTNRGLSSMKGKIKSGENKKIKRTFVSLLATMFVVLYYTFEFFLANIIVFKNRFKGSLVLFDRYYFDHFLQPSSRDLIYPVRKLLLFFVSKPTTIVHLKASSVEIYKRKKDLPEKEIEIQNTYINNLLKDYNNVIELDSVKSNEKELVISLFHKTIDTLTSYK